MNKLPINDKILIYQFYVTKQAVLRLALCNVRKTTDNFISNYPSL